VVTPWYPRDGDGAGSFVQDQVRAVSGRHDVAVLHLDSGRGGSLVRDERVNGVRVVRCARPLPAVPGGSAVGDGIGALAGLRRLRTTGFRPALLHAHVFAAGLAVLPAARMLRLPLVVSEHYSGLARGEVPARGRRAAAVVYRAAGLVSAPSRSLAGTIESVAPGVRVEVVPNPVDGRLFAPPAVPRAPGPPHRLLTVASLEPVKGVAALLEAAGAVARERRDFRLTVIGDGSERARCEALVARLGLADVVELAGRRGRAEVAAAMAEADALVAPSEWETFSVAVAEGLLCGLPVLATRAGALPELVDDASGLLVERSDPGALAEGLRRLLGGLGGWDRGAIARRAAGSWGSERIAERWDGLYLGLSGSGRLGRPRTDPQAPTP
jgi:glycosyltransferase involved in cell wall biosynthesis